MKSKGHYFIPVEMVEALKATFEDLELWEVVEYFENILKDTPVDVPKMATERAILNFIEGRSYYITDGETYKWDVSLLPCLKGEMLDFKDYLLLVASGRGSNETVH